MKELAQAKEESNLPPATTWELKVRAGRKGLVTSFQAIIGVFRAGEPFWLILWVIGAQAWTNFTYLFMRPSLAWIGLALGFLHILLSEIMSPRL